MLKILSFLILLWFPLPVQSDPAPPPTYAHQEFLDALRQCESGGNSKALNPSDSDGTPSYGMYQFKPGTLFKYATKYNVLPDIERPEIMNLIYDPWTQEETVKKMIEDPRVDLSWEFPTCYRKWGHLLSYPQVTT